MKTTLEMMVTLSLAALLGSCGTENVQTSTTPPPATNLRSAVLYLFGAPGCVPCSTLAHGLKDIWSEEPSEVMAKLKVKKYIVVGNIETGEKPTSEQAAAYKEYLQFPFEVVPDEWRFKTYRTYIKNTWSVPAAVILNDKGSDKIRDPFTGKFSASELMDAIRQYMKGTP